MILPVVTIPFANGSLGKSILVVYNGTALSAGVEHTIDLTPIMQQIGMSRIQSVECTANTTGAGLYIGDNDVPILRYCKNSVQTILPLQSNGRIKILLNGGTATNITFAVSDFIQSPVLVPL